MRLFLLGASTTLNSFAGHGDVADCPLVNTEDSILERSKYRDT